MRQDMAKICNKCGRFMKPKKNKITGEEEWECMCGKTEKIQIHKP